MKLFLFSVFFLCSLGPKLFAQTLKVCLDSPPLENDLHKAVDTSSVEVFHKKVYESLISFNKKEKGYFTLLANKISLKGPNTIIIDIKENIPFHKNKFFTPTRNLNADDVVFSFQRQMNKYITDPKDKNSFINFQSRNLDDKIINVEKVGPYQVRIQTKKRLYNLYELLSEHFLAIYSYEYYMKLKSKKKENLFTLYPIGTGPFQFYSKSGNSKYQLKTFKKYHGKIPRFDNLTFYIITDNEKRTQYTIKEKCHITHNPSWALLKEIQNHSNLRIQNYEENNTLYMALNTQGKFTKDKKIREAISLALDYDKYINQLFYGHAKRADHLLTPNFPNYNRHFLPPQKDIKKAKAIMASKYKKPIHLNLWTITVPRPYLPDGIKLAKLVKKDLEKVGFIVHIHKPDFKTFLSKTAHGAHDIALVGFANLTDEQEILLSLSCDAIKGGSNRSMWCHKKYDQLMQLYFATRTKQAKESYLKQASLIFNSEKPRIPIAYMGKKKIISKSILNFNASHDSSGDYSKIIFVDSLLGDKKK